MSIAFADEIVNEVIETVAPAATEASAPPIVNAILGYLVVFIGLALLMVVIIVMGKIMVAASKKKAEKAAETAPAVEAAPVKKDLPAAPGSAGEVKLYDTDPADAAMIMAIVADKLQKPLNELRFVSIKEVK
ncbi:MAG: OadG family protein [Clostridiales bacterium]|nr:OadG family protein [Clostridiales bacterium]